MTLPHPRVLPPSPSDPHATYASASDETLARMLQGSKQHLSVPTRDLKNALFLPPSLRPVLVQVLVRHGDRSPVSTDIARLTGSEGWWRSCPSGPGAFAEAMRRIVSGEAPEAVSRMSHLTAVCGRGQLTVRGVSQCLGTGRDLREHYLVNRGLLGSLQSFKAGGDGDDYGVGLLKSGRVVVRSTVVPRAIESAQGILRTLLPHSDAWRSTEHFDIRREDTDDHLTMSYKCHNLMQYYRALHKTGKFGRAAHGGEDDRGLDAELRAMFGVPSYEEQQQDSKQGSKQDSKTRHRYNVTYMFDNLACRLAHGMPMPAAWSWDHVRRAAAHATSQYFSTFGRDASAARLGIGRLVAEIQGRMETRIGNPDDPARLVVYSGHDTTIAPLLEALGASDGFWPRIASVVAIELIASVDHHGNNRDKDTDTDKAKTSTTTTATAAAAAAGRRGDPTVLREADLLVRVFYNGRVVPVRRLVRSDAPWGLGPAGPLYAYSDFKALAKSLTPDDHALECADPAAWPGLEEFLNLEGDMLSGGAGSSSASRTTNDAPASGKPGAPSASTTGSGAEGIDK